jgi:hypothetical protein
MNLDLIIYIHHIIGGEKKEVLLNKNYQIHKEDRTQSLTVVVIFHREKKKGSIRQIIKSCGL